MGVLGGGFDFLVEDGWGWLVGRRFVDGVGRVIGGVVLVVPSVVVGVGGVGGGAHGVFLPLDGRGGVVVVIGVRSISDHVCGVFLWVW